MTSRLKAAARLAALVIATTLSAARAQEESYRRVDGRDCAIADMPLDASSALDLRYAFPADTDAPGWEEFSTAEVSGWVRFGNWENSSGSDFDLQGLWDTMFIYTGNSDDDVFPLNSPRLHFTYTQRYEANFSFEADASPGIYSTFDTFGGDDFSVPFGARWIKPLTPNVSLFAGAKVYPTFDHVVDPHIGMRVAHRNSVIFDLAYPESRLTLAPHRRMRVSAGARASFWPEYNMGDDPRETLRYQEIRLFGSLELGITPDTLLVLQGGSVMEREVSFEAEAEDVTIEDGLFAGIGLTHLL